MTGSAGLGGTGRAAVEPGDSAGVASGASADPVSASGTVRASSFVTVGAPVGARRALASAASAAARAAATAIRARDLASSSSIWATGAGITRRSGKGAGAVAPDNAALPTDAASAAVGAVDAG